LELRLYLHVFIQYSFLRIRIQRIRLGLNKSPPGLVLTICPSDAQLFYIHMALLSSILGFSLFGLSARMGQLGIQKRNLLESTSSFLFPTFA
jgi:hypothetical protein